MKNFYYILDLSSLNYKSKNEKYNSEEIYDIELKSENELKQFQFTSQDLVSSYGLTSTSLVLNLLSLTCGLSASLISYHVSDILKHISRANPESEFNYTISLFLFSNLLTLHLFMIAAKVVFGIFGNYTRKLLIQFTLLTQAGLLFAFNFMESYYTKLHLLLILVQSLMSIVILVKIWILELSCIKDRDMNIANFHVNLGVSLIIVYYLGSFINSMELYTYICGILILISFIVIMLLPESPMLLDYYNYREDSAESTNKLMKYNARKDYKVMIRYKSLDCEPYEVGFVEYLTSGDENCLAYYSILLCSACKGLLTSLNNFLPHYLTIHHINIHNTHNLSQWFGMLILIISVICGFILKNKIMSKKSLIIKFLVLKMFLELLLYNYVQIDKIYFSYIMMLVKSIDLTLFWVVLAYLCECTPTHIRSIAVYMLVIIELGTNYIGLLYNKQWTSMGEQYISIAVLVTGLYGLCVNIFYNYGVERDGYDMGDCLDVEKKFFMNHEKTKLI